MLRGHAKAMEPTATTDDAVWILAAVLAVVGILIGAAGWFWKQWRAQARRRE